MKSSGTVLKAFLISPNREMADQFTRTLADSNTFRVISDMQEYPSDQALGLGLRELQPDVILLDVLTNGERASGLLGFIATYRPQVFSVALYMKPDGEAIVRLLRAGATEFLSAPFDVASQREAGARITRLRYSSGALSSSVPKVLAFASTKPGSGASTVAAQVAFALKRLTGKRVLLADFDLMGGTIGFYLKVQQAYSLLDAVALEEGRLSAAAWTNFVTAVEGVDVLASPHEPHLSAVESARLASVMELLRTLYDFIVIDLPTIFDRVSLLALNQADCALLVTTSELPSLHLTRKALQMLQPLGFEQERLHIVVNRLNKKDGLDGSDFKKMFNSGPYATLPNDYFSLHRVVTRGEPLSGGNELSRAMEKLARKLAGPNANEKRAPRPLLLGAAPAVTRN